MMTPEESFFVSGKLPELEPGELERAAPWAASVAAKLDTKERVAPGHALA
jgi:hypothetical protein